MPKWKEKKSPRAIELKRQSSEENQQSICNLEKSVKIPVYTNINNAEKFKNIPHYTAL